MSRVAAFSSGLSPERRQASSGNDRHGHGGHGRTPLGIHGRGTRRVRSWSGVRVRGRPAGLAGSERLHRISRAVPIVQDHSREGRSSGPEFEDHVHPHPGPRRRSGERDRHPRLERIVGSAGHGEQGAKQECDQRRSAAPEGAAHRSAPALAARQASRNEATWIDAPSLSPGDARGGPASSRRGVACTDPRTPGIRAQARGEVSIMSRLLMASRTPSVGFVAAEGSPVSGPLSVAMPLSGVQTQRTRASGSACRLHTARDALRKVVPDGRRGMGEGSGEVETSPHEGAYRGNGNESTRAPWETLRGLVRERAGPGVHSTHPERGGYR